MKAFSRQTRLVVTVSQKAEEQPGCVNIGTSDVLEETGTWGWKKLVLGPEDEDKVYKDKYIDYF